MRLSRGTVGDGIVGSGSGVEEGHRGCGLKQEATGGSTRSGLSEALGVIGGKLGAGLVVARLRHGMAGAHLGGAALDREQRCCTWR